MALVVVLLGLAPWLLVASCADVINDTATSVNSSDPNKDMYVIHAMVYQVGIVTNRTDNETGNFNATGNQEALTFYHNNGSQVDLSQIPAPLLTNVTAQSMVGVAPVSASQGNAPNQLPWSTLNHLTNMAPNLPQNSKQSPPIMMTRNVRSSYEDDSEKSFDNLYRSLFRRDVSSVGNTPVAIRKGSATIPQTAGVQSIAIPPLLSLNNNLSQIPVPIPNTSVVHYAKINTLVSKP
ncbi:uncharacterized protein LOC142986513 [Anticarsia gemmatalis]|uniref:uncharacterized protein LOC142986513 n=1 Tax=Anticarsia gemmatalis TaxID=129554 RepID=UPI003F75CD81